MTGQQLLEAAYKYFDWCDKHPFIKEKHVVINEKVEVLTKPVPIAYTIAGFCLHAGICTKTFHQYRKKPQDYLHFPYVRTRTCEVYDAATTIAEIIFDQQFQYAAIGVFSASIISRSLSLANKQDHRHVVNRMVPVQTFNVDGKEITFGNSI